MENAVSPPENGGNWKDWYAAEKQNTNSAWRKQMINLLPYLAVFLILISVYSIGHVKGNASCEIKNAKSEQAAVIKGVEAYGNIEKKVIGLSDSDLDKRLSEWVRH